MRCLFLNALAIAGIGLSGCDNGPVDHKSDMKMSQKPIPDNGPFASSSAEQLAIDKLSWVETADAQSEARAALSSGTPPKIMAMSGRLRTHPGLTPQQYERIKDKVVSELVPGTSDTIRGDAHKAALIRVRDYAAEYNAIIYKNVAIE